MMGRARSRRRIGWPPNLYPNRDGFKYRNPVTKRETWLGRDKARAFAAAKKANALLTAPDDLVARVVGAGKVVRDAIEVFRRDDIPGRRWAPKTAAEYEITIKRIERGLGDRDLESLGVKDCAEFIRGETESTRSRQVIRLVLGWILACAVEEGWIDSNPAMQTRKFGHQRKRERLTAADYAAISQQAPRWLQVAMDLSLLTLLRREDVVSLRFADVRDGMLHVVPAKTEGSTRVRLRIALSDEALGVLAQARDDVVSPFIVHRLPEKARPMGLRAKGREHATQVLPEQLSRAFAKARDAAEVGGDNPPTFHEIRSLGGALLQEAGWSVAQVQALMGHASASMTEHYLEGHEPPWQDVTTGIKRPG
ncbi:tyrosine-type recombinase/integrase [Marilutibacter spongiae]|uniref:Tyrosine-type recombinase/integrase n=1 Tax=Marilutibacter spongiae TaxID=2025720 RepID=A0A7W3TL92_9GAMM|nr:tyrosine-type recombinase/integrase [Lysobacter spongiae]MBB1060371.1 tyrosine-type recombinase/integrase [Lysobacter spongiae]